MRDVVVRNLPAGYPEIMNWGMITYGVPLEDDPGTYNGRPAAELCRAGGAEELLRAVPYIGPGSRAVAARRVQRAGKSGTWASRACASKKLEDLPLDAIDTLIASIPPSEFIPLYENARKQAAAARVWTEGRGGGRGGLVQRASRVEIPARRTVTSAAATERETYDGISRRS